MIKHYLSCSAAILLTVFVAGAEMSWGRGFGGMHGGMHGGGMRGGPGGFGGGPGGMRGGPGGFGGGPGGMRGGPGGMRGGPGGFGGGPGGLGGANFGGRPEGGNFGGPGRGGPGGRPGQAGPGNFGGPNANRPGRGDLGAHHFPGGAAGGFGGNRRGPENAGRREPGAVRPGERPDRGQLGNFLGLPDDGGLHAAAGANRLGRDARGLTRYADADLRRRGDYVRQDFRGGNYYSADWYRRYPGAWYPSTWAYGNAWAAASWDAMTGWFGYGNTEPTYYDYGNTVTYQDNSVYMNGQDMGTSDEYYQQAQDLASTGANATTQDDEQWMPLGVFAMTHDQQTKANLILQLAVNKDGVIRGNYTATVTNDTKPVHGSVDKKTQRAAWTIGDKKGNVIETGIYNLTKDEAPVLVHFGKDKTEQWLLVRVKQDDEQKQDKSSS